MKEHMNDALVVIDSFPRSVERYRDDYAIICVDIARSTTMAATAVTLGRRCFPVATLEEALSLANSMAHERPLLTGGLTGRMSNGFGMINSPAALAAREDLQRPLILLAPDGTTLIQQASSGLVCFVACLRNMTAAAEFLVGRYRKIAVLAAGWDNEVRAEDEFCCARIAEVLARNGYRPATRRTTEMIGKWKGKSPESALQGKTADLLRSLHQEEDLDFLSSHIDDIDAAFLVAEQELLIIPRVFYEDETGALNTVERSV